MGEVVPMRMSITAEKLTAPFPYGVKLTGVESFNGVRIEVELPMNAREQLAKALHEFADYIMSEQVGWHD